MTPEQIAHTHNLRRSSQGYVGPCPKCGGSAKSDKFQIRDDGGFKCYACGFKGDVITWLREMEGKTCPEAFEAAELTCDRHDCAVRATCRMGDGKRRHQPRSVSVPKDRNQQNRTTDQRSPKQKWLDWAVPLQQKAVAALQQNPAALHYLAGRGISAAAAHQYQLGWLDHPRKINRASIGLPAERNGKNTLWVPGGLLISTLDQHGQLHRIRVRRTDEDRQQFRPDLKYVWIEGSGNAPMCLQRMLAKGTVIVEAELDAIAIAAAHPHVSVLALGTVDMPPTEDQHRQLQQTPSIIVALDADTESAAGQKAVKTWLKTYRQAKYWPVTQGKDPGEFVALGGDLAAWITAGLPPTADTAIFSKKQDDSPVSLSGSRRGGRGAETFDLPAHAKGKTLNGHHYVVAYQQQDVAALQEHYPAAVVFSPQEITAIKGMSREEAELVLLAKREFAGQVEESVDLPPPVDPVRPKEEPVQDRLFG